MIAHSVSDGRHARCLLPACHACPPSFHADIDKIAIGMTRPYMTDDQR
eukprot:SAG22_NODE_13755_length_396_cov_0.626263_1_plen_47_part_10